jgi:beta-phosphoglucomutase-like phosphatase (HAD superfamily)
VPIKGVILDMDGVFVETEPLHFQSFKRTFKELQVELTDEYLYHLVGDPVAKNIQDIADTFHLNIDTEFYQNKVEKGFVDILKKTPIGAKPGVWNLINKCKKNNYKIGLCTSSPFYQVDVLLNHILLHDGISRQYRQVFDAIVSLDDVNQKKPHPEPYLFTCRKLNLAPGQCVAIEDSIAGVQSAKAAGCFTVALVSFYNKEKNFSAADRIIGQFDELTFT